jgi:hypothetical protein
MEAHERQHAKSRHERKVSYNIRKEGKYLAYVTRK